MANKIIFVSRHPKTMVRDKKIIPLIKKVLLNAVPSLTDENPIRAFTNLMVKQDDKKTILYLSLDLLHKNVHKNTFINDDFLRKEKIVSRELVVLDPNEASAYQKTDNDEFVLFDDESQFVEQRIRDVFNVVARAMYHGFAIEALVCTALNDAYIKKHTLFGIKFGPVFPTTTLQDSHEKLDCQVTYITQESRGVFLFSIKSSKEKFEKEIARRPKNYQLGVSWFSIELLGIASAVARMIRAKEEGKMLHCFVDKKGTQIIDPESGET